MAVGGLLLGAIPATASAADVRGAGGAQSRTGSGGTPHENNLKVTAVSVGDAVVDARPGHVSKRLTFKPSATYAMDLQWCGSVIVQRAGATPGTFEGAEHSLRFGNGSWASENKPVSVTFELPQYGSSADTRWAVKAVNLAGTIPGSPCPQNLTVFQGDQLTGPGFDTTFTAQTLVDAEAPTNEAIWFDDVRSSKDPVKDGGFLRYQVVAEDLKSGFWQGKATLKGPAGLSVTTLFGTDVNVLNQYYPSCDLRGLMLWACEVWFTLPEDAPAGVWTMDSVELTDAGGASKVYPNLGRYPLDLPGRTLWARNFRLDRSEVDPWETEQTVILTADVSAEVQVIKARDINGVCVSGTPTLPQGGSGTLTLPITVPVGVPGCHPALLLEDANGTTSEIRGLPFITAVKGAPPQARNITLDRTTINPLQGGTVRVSLDVSSWKPGVTRVSVYAHGEYEPVKSLSASTVLPRVRDGHATVDLKFPNFEYWRGATNLEVPLTVGISDAAGVWTSYGFDGAEVPGNPLEINVNMPADTYTGVAPARVLDTRDGTGAPAQPLHSGSGVTLRLTGVGGVPATGVSAVALNVTATDTTGDGYLMVSPHMSYRPSGPSPSHLNWGRGRTIANQVIAPVGVDGKVYLNMSGSGAVSVVADVFGYYSDAPTGAKFAAVTPARLLDTRDGTGAPSAGATPAGGVQTVRVTGRGGVPATGVGAVVLNLTATEPVMPGHLLAWQHGGARPTASSLNWAAGQTIGNFVTVPVGPDGTVDLANISGGNVHLIADVFGYFTSTGEGSRFQVIVPAQVLDTRTAGTPPGPGATSVLAPRASDFPQAPTATAVAVNVTVTDTKAPGHLIVWPHGDPMPTASSVNWAIGDTKANLVTVPMREGKVDLNNQSGGTISLIGTIAGFYVAG
ncbi:hypothetical protein [Embleya hyalina]|uniref:hypothetical protein n=1 Tax=Embleya hyalina TaxID=516124 RepID=UPI000F84239F|nr:hypothetical protein [Embleya hyalina]